LKVVRELLDYPDEYTLKPEAVRELLSRLHELTRETAKRRGFCRPTARIRRREPRQGHSHCRES
jgi:hypothetical protein